MVMHRLLRLAVGHFHASGALASEAVRKKTRQDCSMTL